MRQKNAISCSHILENTASPLLERAQKLQRLERAVLRLLPEDLAAHCRVMNLKKEILVLSATSSAWAARLRFAAPELTKQLRCQFSLNLQSVQVHVRPEALQIQSIRRPGPTMSLASGTLLAQTAQSVNHPGLQQALYRLAAKARDF